jgi:hypothetical protein
LKQKTDSSHLSDLSEFEVSKSFDIEGLSSSIKKLVEEFSSWVEDNFDNFENFAYEAYLQILFSSSGWLLHYTTPFHLIHNDLDQAGLSFILEDYYKNNWTSIRNKIEHKLEKLNIDDEAKETFREALSVHQNGFYRATTTLLFPEIERLFRKILMNGSLNQFASLKEAREVLSNTNFPNFNDGYRRTIFSQAINIYYHTYAPVKTLEDISKFELDSVPNRHACIHGLVKYKSMHTSLNSLFLAEFVYEFFDNCLSNKITTPKISKSK